MSALERARETFAAAGVSVADLTHVPGEAIHPTHVEADAWYDASNNRLMFVGHKGRAMSQFLYYIGEEHNAAVEGVGHGISAWTIGNERGEWLSERVAAYAHRVPS